MALSWNEIRANAYAFVKEWSGAIRENAESQPFWIDFFAIFGMKRKGLVKFEEPVTRRDGSSGSIDVLWPGQILIEQKSKNKNLDDAYVQAADYVYGLRDRDKPKYLCVCDFNKFHLHDLEEDAHVYFTLDELPDHIHDFGFIAGYKKPTYKDQDPANIEAAYLMGRLHDALKDIGYSGHHLEVYLVRVLFCLFAEDTSIFDKDLLRYYIENKTKEDGSDLGAALAGLFQVLNTPEAERYKNLDEDLAAFPYVNGSLFRENLFIASFDRKMRETALDCCSLDWAKISPAIFGSMFQSVMNAEERRNLGAHYTSEKNILKLIKPLFLDELYDEFEKVKSVKKRLTEFHRKLSGLRFLDPACGCGNFLIVTYRELRLLEIKILKILQADGQLATNVDDISWINIDQFYGIEIDEWPARIAEVAMWLIDHQMNMKLSEEFGNYYLRLPLVKTANIKHANALRTDWKELIAPEELSYILGNPPFVGKTYQNKEQKKDMKIVFDGVKKAGSLDFVTSWFFEASKFIQETKIKCAFVSTNSIAQGEQVSILWNELLNKYKIKIHFAHKTFKWSNEAKGKAAVYCIIVGFANHNTSNKYLYEYEDIKGEAQERKVSNINPYLFDSIDIIIKSRRNPINNVPKMVWGNKPVEGGNLLFTDEEKNEFIEKEPKAEIYFKAVLGGREFLYNIKRWCLWLVDASPKDIKSMPLVIERVNNVKEMRLASIDKGANRLAERPTEFRDTNNPKNYIAIPRITSERRNYIPIGFLDHNIIPTDLIQTIPDATKYHFGILTSAMHMAWMRAVCGRLKSDYRYSKDVVYNNYPWPKDISEKQKAKIEELADAVLKARELFPESSLADLYDPLTTPPPLLQAHKALDKAVDRAYRPQPFATEALRLEFLFDLYQEYTTGRESEL